MTFHGYIFIISHIIYGQIVKWKIILKKYMVKIRELIAPNIIYGCFPDMINFIYIEISCALIVFRKFV